MSEVKTLMDFVKAAKAKISEISIDEVESLQASGYSLLDVREPGEYAAGCISDAINIPRGVIEPMCDAGYPKHNPTMLDRNKPWLVICASGGRSAMAADVMQQMGFTNVKSVDGGMAAWQKANKAIITPA